MEPPFLLFYVNSKFIYLAKDAFKVWVAKNLTKRSSVLLLRLVRFSMTQTLTSARAHFFINIAATPPIKSIGSYESKQIFVFFGKDGKDQKINLNSEIKLVLPKIEQIHDWTLLVIVTNVRFESISSGDLWNNLIFSSSFWYDLISWLGTDSMYFLFYYIMIM